MVSIVHEDEVDKDFDIDKRYHKHPETSCNSFAKMMVIWIQPLIHLARYREIDELDVPDSPPGQDTASNTSILEDCWSRHSSVGTQETRSLLMAIFSGYKYDFILSGSYQMAYMIMQLLQPWVIGELLYFLSSGSRDIDKGILLAFSISLISLLSSISFAANTYMLKRTGIAVRSGLMMMVYNHTVSISNISILQSSAASQMTNLITIDTEKIFELIRFIHFLW